MVGGGGGEGRTTSISYVYSTKVCNLFLVSRFRNYNNICNDDFI